MRLSVILPIMVLCLCAGLLGIARSGAAPVEAVARARTGMELLRAYPCHRAETKVVLVKGKEDNFSPEGLEPNFLRPGRDTVRSVSMLQGSYDQSQVDRSFTDSFQTPARMVKGLFVISLRAIGNNENDLIAIGNLQSRSRLTHFSKAVVLLGQNDGWVVEGSLHSVELSQLPLHRLGPDEPMRTVLDQVGGRSDRGWLDVVVSDDTSIDFMGLAACVEPERGKGLTLAVRPASSEQDDRIISLTCNEGTDDAPICNATIGDTPCGSPLPVACLRPGQAPIPRGLPANWDRWIWTGSEIALSEPVPATDFATVADVDRFCSQRMGPGWRAAAFHDGGRPVGISGHGRGDARHTRAWVDIVDQRYGTCWTR